MLHSEQILEAVSYKTAAVWLLTISKMIQNEQNMQETASKEKLKQFTPMDFCTYTPQSWLTCKNLHSSALYRYWMLSRGLSKSDDP